MSSITHLCFQSVISRYNVLHVLSYDILFYFVMLRGVVNACKRNAYLWANITTTLTYFVTGQSLFVLINDWILSLKYWHIWSKYPKHTNNAIKHSKTARRWWGRWWVYTTTSSHFECLSWREVNYTTLDELAMYYTT